MTGESLVGLVAALSGLVGAVGTIMVAMRRERKEIAIVELRELRAYQDAWDWAVRTIYVLLRGYVRAELEEPEGIREKMREHQDNIDHPKRKVEQ